MKSSVILPENTLENPSDQLSEMRQAIELLTWENRLLQEKINSLLHHRFGSKSERFTDGQILLFDDAETDIKEAPKEEEVTVPEHTRKKGGRRKPPKDLPRVRIEHDLSEAEKQCTCGACLTRIDEEISEQYDVLPPVFRVLQHVRFKYVCPRCQVGFKTAPGVAAPLPRCQVSPGLLAWLGTGKFVDSLPLYRQASIMEKRFGIPFTRTTLADWMIKVADRLLAPLVKAMEPLLLGADYLHMDETTLQVLDEPRRRAEQKSYLWVRATGAGIPIILMHYSPSRSGSVADGLLNGFRGYLQTDGYPGYNGVASDPNITQLGCWAHARRKFDAAAKASVLPDLSSRAREALAYVGRLYRIEKEIKDKPLDKKRACRQIKSQAVLDEFRCWIDSTMTKALSCGGILAKAYVYLHNQWPKLIRFTLDGRLGLDNNPAERHVRPVAVGRKNWLFCQSRAGARATATWHSIVSTAQANGLEPYHYLHKVFTEIPRHLESERPVDDLLPWNIRPEDPV